MAAAGVSAAYMVEWRGVCFAGGATSRCAARRRALSLSGVQSVANLKSLQDYGTEDECCRAL